MLKAIPYAAACAFAIATIAAEGQTAATQVAQVPTGSVSPCP